MLQAIVNVLDTKQPTLEDLTFLFRAIDRNEAFDDLASSTLEREYIPQYVIERQEATDSFGRTNIRYSVHEPERKTEIKGYEFYVFDDMIQEQFVIKKHPSWIPKFILKLFSITYQEAYHFP